MLCKECQEIAARGAMLQLHCHHLEKPQARKELCWCDFGDGFRNECSVSVMGHVEPGEYFNFKKWEIRWCPVCGKEMMK